MPEPGRDAQPLVKKKPTVALFSLDKQSHDTLRECFSQFSIDVVAADDASILEKEKLEGCVVSLASPSVEKTVAQARTSDWQKRMVIYAIGPVNNIRNLAQYGLNVILDAPVVRPAALKAIHSTRLLLLNELRRYVRLPLAAPTDVECGSSRYSAMSAEISAGGMSLQCKGPCPPVNSTAYASFAVPGSGHLNIACTVCWTDTPSSQFGLRFEPGAPGRQAIKAWIDDYLDLD
jgi:hypothetical protein